MYMCAGSAERIAIGWKLRYQLVQDHCAKRSTQEIVDRALIQCAAGQAWQDRWHRR